MISAIALSGSVEISSNDRALLRGRRNYCDKCAIECPGIFYDDFCDRCTRRCSSFNDNDDD